MRWYAAELTDGSRSLSMKTLYTMEVARTAYSPVVFSGFASTCFLPILSFNDPAAGPCNWDTSQSYEFEYWTPGLSGDRAPLVLQIQTPAATVRYGAASPTDRYFHMKIGIQFLGGPATLPAVTGYGAVSSVSGLPVSFVMTIAVRLLNPSDVPPNSSPEDWIRWRAFMTEWWQSSGDCIWCASYAGVGTAAGTAVLNLWQWGDPLGSRSYQFAGEEVPEPAAAWLVAPTLALFALACGVSRAMK